MNFQAFDYGCRLAPLAHEDIVIFSEKTQIQNFFGFTVVI